MSIEAFIPTLPETRQEPDWPPPPVLEQLTQDLGAAFVIELIHAFLDHFAATLPIVCAATARGDLGTVAKEAHSIKGSARQLEVEVIGAICEQIEALAKENKLREVQLLTVRLEEESNAVERGLGAYLERLEAQQSASTELAPPLGNREVE
ncbi:MAG: Hpt domain-containing protein [Acidobacteriia bacterium]|nr:Hpt domain-containing protein [Terriglobia bacterium]